MASSTRGARFIAPNKDEIARIRAKHAFLEEFTVPAGTTEIGIALARNCSGTAGADDSLI